MRPAILYIIFSLSVQTYCQEWILVKPGWKYNYGGPDQVIDAQIFITGADTLGPASFLYQLNKVAYSCDTCSMSLQLDLPQFLQRSILVSNGAWWFNDPNSILILPETDLGGTWLADTINSVIAEIIAVDTVLQFGISDVQKTIQCSNSDNWIISKEWGILQFNDHQLIGIHGPEVGVLIPTIDQMYPYQEGDIMEYEKYGHYGIGPYWSSVRRRHKHMITSVTISDSITYGTWRIEWSTSTIPAGSGQQYISQSSDVGDATWSTSQIELPYRDLLYSYPGQLILSSHQITSGSTYHECIAEHGLDSLGRYFMGCPILMDNSIIGNIRYTEGIGLEEYFLTPFNWESYRWRGSVIGGDTTGTVHSDEYFLSVTEMGSPSFAVHPVPADDRLNLTLTTAANVNIKIFDVTGKILLRTDLHGTEISIDVSSLSEGLYLLQVEDHEPLKIMVIH